MTDKKTGGVDKFTTKKTTGRLIADLVLGLPKMLEHPLVGSVLDTFPVGKVLKALAARPKDEVAKEAASVAARATAQTPTAASAAIPPDRVINTDADMRYVLDHIRFHNTVLDFGWQYEFRPHYGASGDDEVTQDGWEIRATFERPDTHTGRMSRGSGRWIPVFKGATETSVFFSVLILVKLLAEHELLEGLTYLRSDGVYVRPIYPHNSLHALMSIQTPDPNFVD
jgi:hypothetical protein